MSRDVINFSNKLELFDDLWSPKIIAQMNNNHFKLAKVKGDFTWHDHKDTDEVFIVIDGSLTIEFESCSKTLEAGEMIVVPKGVRHKPYAKEECRVLIIEPAGTVNTGDAGGEQTAPNDIWI